jgi:hypothetical protein
LSKNKKATPFGYIDGPYYVYTITYYDGNGNYIPIYVGRGKGRRAATYYKIRDFSSSGNYFNPNSHNKALNAKVAEIRRDGREVGIHAIDCKDSKQKCQALEMELVGQYGRVDKGTGTLYNRNGGG